MFWLRFICLVFANCISWVIIKLFGCNLNWLQINVFFALTYLLLLFIYNLYIGFLFDQLYYLWIFFIIYNNLQLKCFVANCIIQLELNCFCSFDYLISIKLFNCQWIIYLQLKYYKLRFNFLFPNCVMFSKD